MSTPAPHTSGIPVFCTFTRLVALPEVRLNLANPNTHPARQVDLYAAVIKANGWRRPVTISNRSGLVVRGEGAVLAARKPGLEFVPADFQDYERDALEVADLLADNRLADFSATDQEALKAIFATLPADLVTGYSAEEYGDVFEFGRQGGTRRRDYAGAQKVNLRLPF